MRFRSNTRLRALRGTAGVLAAGAIVVGVTGVAGAQSGSAIADNPTVVAYALAPPTAIGDGPRGAGGGVLGGGGGTPGTPSSPGASGVAGKSGAAGTSGPGTAPRATVRDLEQGTMPFTGLQLVLMVAGAVALAALGLVLRRSTRPLAT